MEGVFQGPAGAHDGRYHRLLVKDTLVEIDLIGCLAGTTRQAVRSDAPQPLANYTEAFNVGGLVFAAGQLASDFNPASRRRRGGTELPLLQLRHQLQTRFVLENLKKTFEAAGSSLDNVVKAQVFLTDLDNFNGFDEVWKEYFKVPPPRTTIGTTGLLVRDTLVEIDLIGVT